MAQPDDPPDDARGHTAAGPRDRSADMAPGHSAYWRSTLRLSAALLAVWLVVTLAVCLLGPHITQVLFGWPIGFWAAAQGALPRLVFCAIVWAYAWLMDRLDAEHGRASGD